MTSGDERRAMPPSAPYRAENQPPLQEPDNPFKPLSAENRITGTPGRHRVTQMQPTPGASYNGASSGLHPTGPLFPDTHSHEYLKSAPSALPQHPAAPAAVPYRSGERYGGAAAQPPATYSPNPPQPSAPYAAQPVQPPTSFNPPQPSAPYAALSAPFAAIPAKPSTPYPPVPAKPSALYAAQPVQPPHSFNPPQPSAPYVSPSAPYAAVPAKPSAPYAAQPVQPAAPYPPASAPGTGYTPRHGAVGLAPMHPLQTPAPEAPATSASPVVDPWITLGWKAPTTVREEPAYPPVYAPQLSPDDPSEPPYSVSQPYPPAAPYATDAPTGNPYGVPGNSQPYVTPTFTLSGAYPPASTLEDFSAHSPLRDTTDSAPFVAPEPDAAVPPPEPPRENPPETRPEPRSFKGTLHKTWRMALLIVCSLAVLFCVVEVARMISSLLQNEQTLSTDRAQLSEMVGANPDAAVSGVQVLPAGQTYAPTATPQPVRTATPEPRVAQNDPLIGVLDSGSDAQNSDQSGEQSSPQDTPSVDATQTRTRLTAYPDNPLLVISDDFSSLRQQNTDVVGRLTIEGLMNETLVQRNNTYYLSHNARGALGNGGAIFVDESVVLKNPPENLLIRGQASENGKLMAPLLQFGTEGVDFVRRHGIITCQTIYEKADYVVFAVVHADTSPLSPQYFNFAAYTTFQNDAQMADYVQAAKEHSLYPIGVAVQPSDRLLTLATLPTSGDTACWVVMCRMLRSGESRSHIQTE